jgi:hypothetical protein
MTYFTHKKIKILKGDADLSGPPVGFVLRTGPLELWQFPSAGAFPPRSNVIERKFQFVLIIVNVCNLISTIYGISMSCCVSVSQRPVVETFNYQRK